MPLAKLLYGERKVATNIVKLIRKDAKEKMAVYAGDRKRYVLLIEALNELERKQLVRKYRRESSARIIGLTKGGRPKGSKNK